jgi:hypothetical protein
MIVDFDHTIHFYNNHGYDVGFGEEMEESLERILENLKKNLGVCLLNAPNSLESSDIELKFQLRVFEFMDSINQQLNYVKEMKPQQDKLVKILMMQCQL